MNKTAYADGMEQIVSRYDAFVIDQWGVIHDGKQIYPGVIETLENLKSAGKPSVILTNSRKISQANVDRLTTLGVAPDLYTGLISSADALRDLLISRPSAPWSNLGNKAFLVAVPEDRALIQGTQYKPVDKIESADFVLLLSTTEDIPEDSHRRWIDVALKRKLAVFSSSADPLTVSPRGIFYGLAGIVATIEREGGTVINTGKPHAPIYEQCLKFFPSVSRDKVLAIGDQMATDVVGAGRFGFHSAIVMTGAGSVTFQDVKTQEDATQIAMASASMNVIPTWVIPSMQWKPEPSRSQAPLSGVRPVSGKPDEYKK